MQKSLARELRRNTTKEERLLWARLRDRRLDGLKFRRQVPLLTYVVDFLCQETRLIIELDGSQHADQTVADSRRTAQLEAEGYLVLRIWNLDVKRNMDGVLETILDVCRAQPASKPLSPRGEGLG